MAFSLEVRARGEIHGAAAVAGGTKLPRLLSRRSHRRGEIFFFYVTHFPRAPRLRRWSGRGRAPFADKDGRVWQICRHEIDLPNLARWKIIRWVRTKQNFALASPKYFETSERERKKKEKKGRVKEKKEREQKYSCAITHEKSDSVGVSEFFVAREE